MTLVNIHFLTKYAKQAGLSRATLELSFNYPKNLGSKSVWVQVFLGAKKLFVPRKFRSRKFVGPTNFGSKNLLGLTNFSPKIFWVQKCWVQTNLGPTKMGFQNIFCQKNIGSKNVDLKIMITLYHFIMDHSVSCSYGSPCILLLWATLSAM